MAFRQYKISSVILSALVACLTPANPAAAIQFETIYIGARLGTVIAHPLSTEITIDQTPTNIDTDPGFTAQAAFGLLFSQSDQLNAPFDWRVEAELGYWRYNMSGHSEDTPPPNQPTTPATTTADTPEWERGSFSGLTLFWNNYLNLLPRNLAHQLWIGLGVGTARWQQDYFDGANHNPSAQWDAALNASLGYHYRLTSQLNLGATWRYLHIFAHESQKQSQILLSVHYGF